MIMEVLSRKRLINKDMVQKRVEMSYEECMEKIMSPAQQEIFRIVDEYWKMYGHSPTLQIIAEQRGKMGLANTKKIVDRLVRLGVLKRVEGMHRTIRPVYINFRTLE
jgi:SOS-response transcriptional repressor LexA